MFARSLRASLFAACLAIVSSAASAAALAPAIVPVPVPVPEDQTRFYAFLREFKAEALTAGIMPATYDRAVSGISLNSRVEELNEKQPEFVRPIWEYLGSAVSEMRVARGRELIAANRELFARLEASYGVPAEVLTAIWGLESGFGQNEGSYNLFEALATLAFDGPRAAYGRRQFIAALKIAEIEGRDPKTMTGSWAGAFGETQFVPTTFLDRAVDGDGDGKRDVWHSAADALASAANYLQQSGWVTGQAWGEEVRLPENFAYENADPDIRKPTGEWSMMGVLDARGEPLKDDMQEAAIFLPAGHRGPAFLVRDNFNVILKYNFATAYALAIGMLADRFKGAAGIAATWPLDELPLDEFARMKLQEGLTALGFDTGGTDGVLGRRTRSAVREYQKARGLPADGFATAELFTRVLNEEAALR
jgi:membrane-bound lytic murein transglycosylase B